MGLFWKRNKDKDIKTKKEDEHFQSLVIQTMKKVRERYSEIASSMEWGAYIAPEHYFVSYVFDTDAHLSEAKASGLTSEINEYHKEILKGFGYPIEAVKDCSFDSQETCDREFKGNWCYYFK